ncbi:hypothetical protein KC19_2G078800 [Ceratodon purpureus]|uniref:Uncharacterized protein n=1 Tax=Ceratodon purpureus TaxID=3225 RepID=A0A8T0IV87_CERPU|nr:hypothetical protein KC19_2G078800 [Ceratodon purpureus]
MRSRQRCAETWFFRSDCSMSPWLVGWCLLTSRMLFSLGRLSFSSTRWLRSKLCLRRHYIADVMSSIQSKLDWILPLREIASTF